MQSKIQTFLLALLLASPLLAQRTAIYVDPDDGNLLYPSAATVFGNSANAQASATGLTDDATALGTLGTALSTELEDDYYTEAEIDAILADPSGNAGFDPAEWRTDLVLGGLATLDILDEDDMATDSATRPPSQQSVKAYVDLRNVNNLALTKFQDALIRAHSGSGDQALTMIQYGDSLGFRASAGLAQQIITKLGDTSYVGFGGMAGSGFVSEPGGGGRLVTYTVENNATVTLADWTYSTSGRFGTMSEASDAIRFYGNNSGRGPADYLVVEYVKVNGGGTFKIQSSTTSISSGFADETGYTAIDTDNGGAIAFGVARIPVAYDSYAIRTEWVSGGDVIITDIRFEMYDEGPSINTVSGSTGGVDALTMAGSNAAMLAGSLGSTDPDIITFMFDDDADDISAWADFLHTGLTTAVTNDGITYPLVVAYASGPKDGFDSTMEAQRDALRLKCIAYGWVFVDAFAAGGEDWDLLDAAGLGGDGTHLDNRFYQALNFQVARELGLNDNIYPVGTLVSHDFSNPGVRASLIQIARNTETSPTVEITTNSGNGADLFFDLNRNFQGWNAAHTTQYWNFATNSAVETSWIVDLAIGSETGPKLTDNSGSLEVDGSRVLDTTDLDNTVAAVTTTALTPSAVYTYGAGIPDGLVVSVSDDGDDTGTITLYVKDANGNAESGTFLVEFWVDADGGAPGASIGTLAITTGTQIEEVTADAHYRALTNASGQLQVTITPTAVPDDVYCTAIVGSQVVTDSATIADN